MSYYPGCSLTGTAAEYDHSIREVAGLLDIDLEELEDWNWPDKQARIYWYLVRHVFSA